MCVRMWQLVYTVLERKPMCVERRCQAGHRLFTDTACRPPHLLLRSTRRRKSLQRQLQASTCIPQASGAQIISLLLEPQWARSSLCHQKENSKFQSTPSLKPSSTKTLGYLDSVRARTVESPVVPKMGNRANDSTQDVCRYPFRLASLKYRDSSCFCCCFRKKR